MASAMITIENRTRQNYTFEAFKPNPVKGGPPIHDHDNDLVIGDMANTPELMASHKIGYSRRCPAPEVTISKERFDQLSAYDRRFLEAGAKGDPDAEPPVPPMFRIRASA